MIVGKPMKLMGVIHLQKMRTEVEYKIQKRLNTARENEHIFKISKISIVNDSKQIYTVLSSPNARRNMKRQYAVPLHVHARTIKRMEKMYYVNISYLLFCML